MRIPILGAALLLTLPACSRPSSEPAASTTSSSWGTTRDALIEEYLKAQPSFAIYQGRHEFDGQLPDWSADGIAAEVKRLHAARDRAAAVTGLTGADAFERDYLISQYDDDLFWLEDVQMPFGNPAFYIGAIDPSPYLTRNYAHSSSGCARTSRTRGIFRVPPARFARTCGRPWPGRSPNEASPGSAAMPSSTRPTLPRCLPRSRTPRCRRSWPTPTRLRRQPWRTSPPG